MKKKLQSEKEIKPKQKFESKKDRTKREKKQTLKDGKPDNVFGKIAVAVKEVSEKMTRKQKLISSLVAGALVVILIASCIISGFSADEEVTYLETQVKYGSLSVGVTESGSVDIGTVEQTFDLDMSALQRASTSDSSSSSSSGGGMNFGGGGADMFSQIFSMAGGSTFSTSGDASTLTIADVLVSVGQEISEGDVLYELEEESVTELTEELESNVEKAKADFEAVYADQVLSKQQAQNTYDTSVAYGSYAQTEYDSTVAELTANVTSAQEQLEEAQESLADYQSQLEEITVLYDQAVSWLASCQYSLDNSDKENDVYGYVSSFKLVENQQSTVDTLEDKKEQLESNIDQAEANVETAENALAKAQRNLSQGLLTAKETLDLRNLAYNTAQETYDIAIAYLEDDASEQEETCAETEEKWEEYSSYVDGTSIRSKYNGVITSIDLEEGDTITTGTVLVTLYDMDEVSMTVSVDEDDMTNISLGSEAAINLTAYPDQQFRATVTEIDDAVADSDGDVTYDVTVTFTGDVSGLFQSMTGEITFITEEQQDCIYVSRRAIITENDKTFVLVRDENGKIKKVSVESGFTDGTNTQIVSGLEEGDTVLVESKVSG